MPIVDPPCSVVTRAVHILAAAGVTVLPLPIPREARPGRREERDCEPICKHRIDKLTGKQDLSPMSLRHADHA
jgi:hypothetical protein